MTDSLMATFTKEGQELNPTVETEKDNSADSSTEETDTDSTQSQEEEENSGADKKENSEDEQNSLDKHPRWREREDNWKDRFNKQEERHVQSLQELREEFESKYGKKDTEVSFDDVPEWFGGDEDAYKKYLNDQSILRNQIKEETLNAISEKGKKEEQAQKEATEYMNSEIANIEKDKELNPDGVKIDRNKLLKYVLDNELVDTKGKWNYKAGWRIMQAGIKSVKSDALKERKNIAAATTSEGRAESEKPDYSTSEDFKNPQNRPW